MLKAIGGGVFCLLAVIAALLVGIWMKAAPPPVTNHYNVLPAGAVMPQPATWSQPPATPNPPQQVVFGKGGDTVVHHHPPAPEEIPVEFENSYQIKKDGAWSSSAGFRISAPAGTRDAINSANMADRWKKQQDETQKEDRQASQANPPVNVVNRPVVIDRPVPVYVPVPAPVVYPLRNGYYRPPSHYTY